MIDLSNAGKAPVLLAAMFAVMVGYQGIQSYKKLVDKAVAQEAVTDGVQRWKQSYRALAGSVQQWEKSYRREDSVQDMMTLYGVVDLGKYGLQADIDTLGLQKVSQVQENNLNLGLTKICLSSSTSGELGTFEVRASNYQALFDGLKHMAARPDLHIGTISVIGDRPVPMARLGDFCVLLRKN